MTNAEKSIFICHCSEDKSRALELYTELKRSGFDPWLDKESILPGQNWQSEIPKALKNADYIIILFSSNSVSKYGYVQREYKLALDVLQDIPDGNIHVIPARLDDCEIPSRFSHLQYCDFFEISGIEKIIKAINYQESIGKEKLRNRQYLESGNSRLSELESSQYRDSSGVNKLNRSDLDINNEGKVLLKEEPLKEQKIIEEKHRRRRQRSNKKIKLFFWKLSVFRIGFLPKLKIPFLKNAVTNYYDYVKCGRNKSIYAKLFSKISRIPYGLILISFFLPWFSVSCSSYSIDENYTGLGYVKLAGEEVIPIEGFEEVKEKYSNYSVEIDFIDKLLFASPAIVAVLLTFLIFHPAKAKHFAFAAIFVTLLHNYSIMGEFWYRDVDLFNYAYTYVYLAFLILFFFLGTNGNISSRLASRRKLWPLVLWLMFFIKVVFLFISTALVIFLLDESANVNLAGLLLILPLIQFLYWIKIIKILRSKDVVLILSQHIFVVIFITSLIAVYAMKGGIPIFGPTYTFHSGWVLNMFAIFVICIFSNDFFGINVLFPIYKKLKLSMST